MVNRVEDAPLVKLRRSEQAYVIEALKRLRRLGIKCRREVGLMGRSADLAFLHEDKLCTVEFKLKDWRRAFVQARDHKLGADLAFVCLPGKSVTPDIREHSRASGVGLLAFQDETDWPFAVIEPAKPSEEVWPTAHRKILETLT